MLKNDFTVEFFLSVSKVLLNQYSFMKLFSLILDANIHCKCVIHHTILGIMLSNHSVYFTIQPNKRDGDAERQFGDVFLRGWVLRGRR